VLSQKTAEVAGLGNRGIIIGGGAFGREALNWAWDCKSSDSGVSFSMFVDADPKAFDAFSEFGMEYLGDPDSFMPQSGDLFLIAIGDPTTKDKIVGRLAGLGAEFATIVHPSAVVARTAKIGRGVVVGPHSYVATNATLGNFSCVNSLTGVGHDVVLGQSCTISSQVDLTGGVSLGHRVFVGSGARVLPRVTVGDDAKVGAGSIVVRDIKAGGSVFAQPARKI
jgi:sugar O-acyltransferase (sialic acid O-acetyltransferase NeuD family)